MTTVDAAGRPAGSPDNGQSNASLWTNPDLRRLVGFLLAGVMLAIMSGPEGRLGQPAYAVSQSLHPKHLLICLAIGVAAWGLATLYLHNRRSVQRSWRPVRESASAFWDRRAVRLGLSAVVLAFFIALPYLVSDLWQGVLVEQIGVYALLAIGLNVVVGFA